MSDPAGCKTVKCTDLKDGVCHYPFDFCKYEDMHSTNQELAKTVIRKEQRISDLERENAQYKEQTEIDYGNIKILRAENAQLRAVVEAARAKCDEEIEWAKANIEEMELPGNPHNYAEDDKVYLPCWLMAHKDLKQALGGVR